MFGILILVCILAVFGFLYSWIAQMVSREEVEVWKGMVILITSGIAGFVGSAFVEGAAPGMSIFVQPLIYFGALTLMSHLIARLTLKHAAIVALIYTVLLEVMGFALSACAAAAAPST